MKAIIWAAGLGTRLRPLTEHMPKAMVPILNKPMLDNALALCTQADISDIVINLHYFPDTIRDHLDQQKHTGLNLEFSYEEDLLENAGAIVKVKSFFDNEPFVAIASDNLTDINLTEMIAFHEQNKALVTIATTKADDVNKYGIVASDEANKVTSFQEKPLPTEAKGDQIATCVYVFSPQIFEHLPAIPKKCHFGKNIFPDLITSQERIFAYRHSGYWNDIGHPGNYLSASFDVLNKQMRYKREYKEYKPDIYIGEETFVDPSAKLIAPVSIGHKSHIAAHAVVGPHVSIGDNCSVEEYCHVERSLLWNHCIIESKSIIWESILAEHCRVYKNNQIKNLVLGAKSHVNKTSL